MKAIRADLLDFDGTPGWGDVDSAAVRWRPDHWLLVGDDGRIGAVQPPAWQPPPGTEVHDLSGHLLLPGFVDTHVHAPQLDVIVSYGSQLLDWLETYTFPAESRYGDPDVAQAGADRFLDALLAHGTTSTVAFPTVHKVSADRLFDAARTRGMRLITGKVLMDRNAPDALRDDVVQAERDCLELIERWHGVDRLSYAVTVRFAPTSTPEQLAMAGSLCRADPTLYMQTHVAENQDEVRWVQELFPQARSYLDVYARAGLLHRRSVLAHGIWLDDADRRLLLETGAQIAHSPTSNTFLGSGLFDWRAMDADGVAVSVATDVGGGPSLSMLRTLAEAYKVQALRGERLTAWRALHGATLAPAQALGLEHEIGSFEPGRTADVCAWRWAVGEVAAHRLSMAHNLHEKVFAWLMLGDERNLARSYVAGRIAYQAPSPT